MRLNYNFELLISYIKCALIQIFVSNCINSIPWSHASIWPMFGRKKRRVEKEGKGREREREKKEDQSQIYFLV